MSYTCSFCGISKYFFKGYTRHLRLFHESQPNFYVICNIEGCKKTATAMCVAWLDTYPKHIKSSLAP